MAKRFEKAKEYTKKYGPQLFPCRTCGNKDIRVVSDRMIFPAKDGWSVVCATASCDCTGIYPSARQAVARWNEMQGGGCIHEGLAQDSPGR